MGTFVCTTWCSRIVKINKQKTCFADERIIVERLLARCHSVGEPVDSGIILKGLLCVGTQFTGCILFSGTVLADSFSFGTNLRRIYLLKLLEDANSASLVIEVRSCAAVLKILNVWYILIMIFYLLCCFCDME